MTYEPLPDTLKVGDKIGCQKWTPDERLEVYKVADGRVHLMRMDGVALKGDGFTRNLLADYDYKILLDN